MSNDGSRAPADVDRLLRHAARNEVEQLEQHHAPVDPRELAERVVYAYHHLAAARAHRVELIATIADYVRELRANGERS
jgi:hypothetical protein